MSPYHCKCRILFAVFFSRIRRGKLNLWNRVKRACFCENVGLRTFNSIIRLSPRWRCSLIAAKEYLITYQCNRAKMWVWPHIMLREIFLSWTLERFYCFKGRSSFFYCFKGRRKNMGIDIFRTATSALIYSDNTYPCVLKCLNYIM